MSATILSQMQTHLSIGLNTIYQVLSRASTAVVALIVTRLLTTRLGVIGYGEYQIVVAYVSLFWILTDFGMNTLVVREITSDEAKTQEYFSALFTARAIFGLILTAIALGGLIVLPYSPTVKIAIVVGMLTIFFQAVMGSATAIFQIKLAYQYQFLTNLVGSLTLLAALYLILRVSNSVEHLVIGFASGYLVMMIATLAAARKWVQLRLSHDWPLVKDLVKKTVPFGLALLFSLATFKLDALLLSVLELPSLTNEAAVGIYNLGYKVFELAIVAPIFFMNVMYPILNRQFSQGAQEKLRRDTLRSAALLLVGGLAALAFIYLTAPVIIRILANNGEFADSITVLRLLSFGLPIFYLTPLLMFLILIFLRQRWLVYIYGAGFAFNLATNLIFIPRYHYVAAAITTGLTELLLLVLLLGASIHLWRRNVSSNTASV